jgi:two-component system response regulator AtoC
VLVVDDEELIRWSVVERLRADGHETLEAGTAAEALERADAAPDLVLLDDKLPDADSLSAKFRVLDPDLLFIMLTDHKTDATAADMIQAGAFDYATKPIRLEDVALRVNRALETTRLRRELRVLRSTLSRPYHLGSIVGESEAMRRVKALVRKIATSHGSTVLITGENGTGKDLIAKVIHYASHRAGQPFLDVPCLVWPEAQLESEIFGHEPGAFPDASAQKRGVLEQGDDGTVFFDEIADLTPPLQANLLRFLEKRTFQRIGGAADIHVDVRLVAATSRNLEEQVRLGKFREDLYYRLNVLRVELPPLRLRDHDVVLLAQFFADAFGKDFRRPVKTLSPAAETALRAYAWPGNVRELRNLVERAVLLSEGDVLEPGDFESLHTGHVGHGIGHAHGGYPLPAEGVALEEVEKNLVVQALERAGGNQTRAAALLGLHRDQIRYRIEKFGLSRKH